MVDGWMDDNNKLLCLESFAKNKKNQKFKNRSKLFPFIIINNQDDGD